MILQFIRLTLEGGYKIIDAGYMQAPFTAPAHSWKRLIARSLRRVVFALFGKDRGVRLLGAGTLIVLAAKKV